MKKTALVLMILVTMAMGVILVRTVLFRSDPGVWAPAAPFDIDRTAALTRLSGAVRLKTVSFQDPGEMDPGPFLAFQAFLDNAFPALSGSLEKEVINQYALLYKWQGKNPSLKPAALLAHYDVVPVARESEDAWTHPPFSGQAADGYVWGRGTLDMKGSLMAILEAVEILVRRGFTPDRTLYLAFGHDEEVGGENGAARIAAFLKDNGVRLSFTLDEGMVVLDKGLSPSKKQMAVIGVAEKGYVTLEVTSKGRGGHSSMPALHTPIGMLAGAAHSLETHQMPARLSGPAGMLFDTIGPDLPLVQKALFANQWAFAPLILSVLEKKNTTNAMIRTTTALTMIEGGIKENVLPDRARLLVNFRILPGDTKEMVLAHARKAIGSDAIQVRVYRDRYTEASPVSRTDTEAYAAIRKTVGQVFGNTPAAPGLVMAGTDSKHYTGVADNCYRFAPFVFGSGDPARIHGVNERVSAEGYIRAITYYGRLIENTCQ